ncbi:MAG: hypothetical protein JNM96_08235, partial [Bacteroidia bacterium]|nr:hypothetical protein [Bacteroidia bacterium]
MSKRINKDTKSLDELLKQINNPDDNIDAFEQDALEGFASLENNEDVLRLKSKLDERFEKEILEKKKKPLVIYWAAAASIVLLVGIFVIFKSTFNSEKQNLALNEADKNAEFVQTPGSEVIQKPSSTIITEEESKPEKVSGKKDEADGKAQVSDKRITTLQEKEVNDIVKEDAAKAEPMADEQKQNAVPPAPADDFAKQGPGSADNKKSTLANASSGGASGEAVKTKDADKKMEDSENREETKSAPKPRLIKKEKSKNEAAPESATAPAQKTPSEIEGAFEKSNIGFATLTISQNDLKAKLEKFFSDKSYKKAFNCTLTINVSNQVEEVVFENKKIFKKSELKELEN